MDELTETDRVLLDVWTETWRYPGARDSFLYRMTGLSPTSQHQRLNRLRSVPAAWEYAPHTMRRVEMLASRHAG